MSQRLRFNELAPEGMAALRAFEHYLNSATSLSAPLREFVRLRASILNGCEYCVAMHRNELAKHHEPETRMDAVSDWQSSDAFTLRERAALAWADAVTNLQQTHCTDAEFAAVTEYFTGKDLADLTLVIASINAWNRLTVPFRAQFDPARAGGDLAAGSTGDNDMQDAVQDDGSKVVDE